MKKFFGIALLAATMSGCAVNYTAQDFLVRDTQAIPIDLQALDRDGWVEREHVVLKQVDVPHRDGSTGKGVYAHVEGAKYLVVYFGGNGFKIRDAGPMVLSNLARVGADVLWIDYRGQGATGGEPTVPALYADAGDVMDYAAMLGMPIVAHGTSMGSLVATKLRADPRVKGVVLDGAISSAPQLVDQLIPFYWKPFVRVQLDDTLAQTTNLPVIAASDKPVLFLVGDGDATTPVRFSQALYDAAPGARKSLVVVAGAHHGDAVKFDTAQAAYRAFLAGLE